MIPRSHVSAGMRGSGRAEARWQHLTIRSKVDVITRMGSKSRMATSETLSDLC